MSVDAQTLLDQTEAAISALLQSLANVNVQDYTLPNGQRIIRADFQRTLDSLFKSRDSLRVQIAAKTRSPIRLGRIGRPSSTRRF